MIRDKKFRWRGLVGGLLLIPVAVAVTFSEPYIGEGTWGDFIVETLAYAAFMGGLAFRFWATLYIGGRKEQSVVNEGPYSICRNPLYVGSFLLALSIGLFLQSIVFALALVLVLGFYIAATIPSEEKFLLERLGEPYRLYLETVPRYWPRFSLFRSPPAVEVSVKGLRLECKRALLWIWLPVLGELVTSLRSEPSWPHWFRLL